MDKTASTRSNKSDDYKLLYEIIVLLNKVLTKEEQIMSKLNEVPNTLKADVDSLSKSILLLKESTEKYLTAIERAVTYIKFAIIPSIGVIFAIIYTILSK